ncbi:outer membrane protein RatA [Salmonella enterica subsp. enterica]|nr:outer membrane protein RatA [Salmonella enterica subsp. enterica]
MWGHMQGVVDAGNLYRRPLLAVETSHKDGQFSENNEEWATFNSVEKATAQCGIGQVPDQSSLTHLYSEHAGGKMESEHAGQPKTITSPRTATLRERRTSTLKTAIAVNLPINRIT